MYSSKVNPKAHQHKKTSIHAVLAHSYIFYFASLLIGIFMDLVLPLRLFSHPAWAPLGAALIFFSSMLLLWTHSVSRKFKALRRQNTKTEIFLQGPYRYSRIPTHLGLSFLLIGFGLVVNAPFIILTTIISFIVSKVVFIKQEETILERKYGLPYLEYKKFVHF